MYTTRLYSNMILYSTINMLLWLIDCSVRYIYNYMSINYTYTFMRKYVH